MFIPRSLAILCLCLILPLGGSTEPRLQLLSRSVTQRGSSWYVRYHVVYRGAERVTLSASEVQISYSGWVANSRCRAHATPRRSQAQFKLVEGSRKPIELFAANHPSKRCREWISFSFTDGAQPSGDPPRSKVGFLPITLHPNRPFWLYVTLDHDHFLYGDYDALLGGRQLQISLGENVLYDYLELNRPNRAPAVKLRLNSIPRDRMDNSRFRSPPGSLYLAADLPGYQYFRFDDLSVRYGSRLRLVFWYLLAPGSAGDCKVRVLEYQDTPSTWYKLDGGIDKSLTVQGKWTRVEEQFQVRDDATTIAVDFRFSGTNIGELWVDDIILTSLPIQKDP